MALIYREKLYTCVTVDVGFAKNHSRVKSVPHNCRGRNFSPHYSANNIYRTLVTAGRFEKHY